MFIADDFAKAAWEEGRLGRVVARGVARGKVLYLGATNVAIVALGILTGLLAARLLGPEGRGQLAEVVLWPQLIAGIFSLSIGEVVAYSEASKKNRIPRKYAHAAVLLLVLIGWGAGSVFIMLFGRNEFDQQVNLTLLYLFLYLPGNFLSLLYLGFLNGNSRDSFHAAVRLSVPLAYLTAILVVWLGFEPTVMTFVLADAFATFIAAVLAAHLSRVGNMRTKEGFSAQEFLRLGVGFHGANVAALLAVQSNRILIVTLAEPAIVGEYVVAYTVAWSSLGVVSQALAILLLPAIAKLANREDQQRVLRTVMLQAFGALSSIAVLLLLVGDEILNILVGDKFSLALDLAGWLAIAMVPQALRAVMMRGLRGMGRSDSAIKAELVALASILLFASLGWVIGGVWGFVTGLFVANTISFLFLWLATPREEDVKRG